MRTIFREGRTVKLIDQTRLPWELAVHECRTADALCEAIASLRIRGAPALGVAGAYGMALAAEEGPEDAAGQPAHLQAAAARIKGARPTAVNLAWGVERALARWAELGAAPPPERRQALWALADALADEDVRVNQAIGQQGAELVPDGARVLTHCNTGSLAAVDWGTALGVVRSAVGQGKQVHVFVDETRPFLQGARLTAWELAQAGIPYTIITDSMAGSLMAQGEIDLCLVGADRIAACGDVANKIGTYSVAVLAHVHGLPFYVAAPRSTIDLETERGSGIPIEERSEEEVLSLAGVRIAPPGARARHPAFDVTPARLVTAIITEVGVLRPPYERSLREALFPTPIPRRWEGQGPRAQGAGPDASGGWGPGVRGGGVT